MKYKFFDHTADVLFQAFGGTIEEAFSNAALATGSVMINPTYVESVLERKISVSANKYETLLYEFLEELIVLVDSEEFLLHNVRDIVIKDDYGKYVLDAVFVGDKLSDKYITESAVKSVTYSEMKVEKSENGYMVQVVLDI